MRRVLASFITTTTHGSWLPGDLRGYLEEGRVLPGDPAKAFNSYQRLKKPPVLLTEDEQRSAFCALRDACVEFHYHLLDVTVEPWHLHFLVVHGFDPTDRVVGRLKNRVRQALDRGRVWTRGYFGVPLYSEAGIHAKREYIAGHPGCRMTGGEPRARS